MGGMAPQLQSVTYLNMLQNQALYVQEVVLHSQRYFAKIFRKSGENLFSTMKF